MQRVEIRLQGHLDRNWAEWLEGFNFTHTEQDETVLAGMVPDQAGLYGLMAKLRDMGVKLLSVSFSEIDEDCQGDYRQKKNTNNLQQAG